MRENRFYYQAELKPGSRVELERTVSVHVAKVLRMKEGDQLTLFNGDGYDYSAVISALQKTVTVTITQQSANHTESPVYTELGQAICRGDRMDYSIQKAVEMGVSAISPLITERVQFRMDARRLDKKMQHWHGVLVAACEQSGRATLPRLNEPLMLNDWLTQQVSTLLVLDPEAKKTIHDLMATLTTEQKSKLSLLIGPEGGLSLVEINQAIQSGHAISLGPRILRTETAGTAILALLQSYCGDC